MARILPDGWKELAVTGAAVREIETLHVLARGLSEAYTVYHGVHWTNLERHYSIYGEIDFAVVNRAGDLLLIEQKSGFLEETPEGLAKNYSGKTKLVALQLARNRQALVAKLAQRLGQPPSIEYLLYCPDYLVKSPQSAGITPGQIVDAGRRGELANAIRSALPERESTPKALEVHRFLQDILQLEPDVNALVGRAQALVGRLSGGLAHWGRQLDFTPFHLRVTGTAGSGKTQLALAEYRDALVRGRQPLYVCFNRPLADHFSLIAPTGGVACTFHSLCERLVRGAGRIPDFTQAGAFERLVEDATEISVPQDSIFDTVIVDEGQDFPEAWRDLVLRHAAPTARVLWLEDPLQNLYVRPPVALPGWVAIRANTNYRSPRGVVRLLQAIVPKEVFIEAASPFDTDDVEFLTYRDDKEMLSRVLEGVRLCFSGGFRKEDVAIISFRGREGSTLLACDHLGPNTLRSFTGKYDLLGYPIYSEGEILTESVYRFKGQAAPAVVFAEIDFEMLDDKAVRKLFVGATRAMMKLVLVLSERAAQQLLSRLG